LIVFGKFPIAIGKLRNIFGKPSDISRKHDNALTYQSHILSGSDPQSSQGILLDRFMNLVKENFREQRDVGFYADKLCLTPKYLSKVIRDNSGSSADEWIDNYVTLEAKALLKSTNMTIQQISEELNSPSQSFFGKYFKRIVGVSPSEYRKW
jgi:AraC-like DNA-binding protein